MHKKKKKCKMRKISFWSIGFRLGFYLVHTFQNDNISWSQKCFYTQVNLISYTQSVSINIKLL